MSGDRLVIAGVPKAGKTTLATRGKFTCPGFIRHTDDLIDPSRGWSDVSAEVATWLDLSGPWIIEGVAAVRALRKWFATHPEGTPCDRVIWLNTPLVPLTPGQETMAKGCRTIWADVRLHLVAREVQVAEL